MVTDAMLEEAAGEAEDFLLSAWSWDGEHRFSSRFERKMARLTRRTDHPLRYQLMRSAAAIVLALSTLFGAVLAMSPEARASVLGWVRRTFSVYSQYESHTMAEPGARHVYTLPEVPEGYTLLNTVEQENGKLYIFANDGAILRFSYTYGGEGCSLFIEAENYDISAAAVGQFPADVYIARNSDETNMIVWQDPSEGVLFFLSARLDKPALIELAESVEKRD